MATPAKTAQTSNEKFPQTAVQTNDLMILASTDELFNHVDDGLPMWADEGDREVVVEILFQTPFLKLPAIILNVVGIDSAHDQNLRYSVTPINITTKGFSIQFKTWGDTHIARASVSWQATGLV